MPTTLWDVELPLAAELPESPRGVVLHWTGGGPRANSVDLGAYHFVVEQDGTVRRGRWAVAANMRQVGGDDYAMHTGGFNSYRVGISAAGMLDYGSPANPGPHPITEVQVDRMAQVAAYFLELAGLDPLDPRRLCTHREVWTLHSIKGKQNHLKKDIEFLPFRPDLGPEQVGDYLRRLTAEAMGIEPQPEAPPVEVPVIIPEVVQPEPAEPWWRRLTVGLRG